MKIKKYEVSDMKEALSMIKEELGPNAVILSTRKVMKSNSFGLFAKPILEVTAAVEAEGSAYAKTAPRQKQQVATHQNVASRRQAYSEVPQEEDDGVTYSPFNINKNRNVAANKEAMQEELRREQKRKKELLKEHERKEKEAQAKKTLASLYNDPRYKKALLDAGLDLDGDFFNEPLSSPKKPERKGYDEFQGFGDMNEDDDSFYGTHNISSGRFSEEDIVPPQRLIRKSPSYDEDEESVAPLYSPRRTTPAPKRQQRQEEQEVSAEKSQLELNAEKMAAIIKAVGLDKFTDLLQDVGSIKKQLDEIGDIKNQIASMHTSLKSNSSENILLDLPTALKPFHSILIKNGVDDIISFRILKSVSDSVSLEGISPTQIKSLITERIESIIAIEPNYPEIFSSRIIAIAGPTGVGKTTTIAKIAATMALKHRKSVCLITVDNFRIGAVEQLKTYAEIVNLPLYVATSPAELLKVVKDVSTKYECVLIDSMGRGQFDSTQIKNIKEFFAVDERITSILVLSMAANHAELSDSFDKYASVLTPSYLIFTKLDETKYFGPLLNIPVKKKVPLLLLTVGQNVPDDMEEPNGKKIAKKLLQEVPASW